VPKTTIIASASYRILSNKQVKLFDTWCRTLELSR